MAFHYATTGIARGLIALFLTVFLPVIRATSAAPDTETVRQLIEEVRALRQRVQDLERLAGSGTQAKDLMPATPADPVGITRPDESATQKAVSTPPPVAEDSHMAHESHSVLSSPLLGFHGYADLGYRAANSAGGTNGFLLGQADLFVTSKLSGKLSFLLETAVDSNEQNEPAIEIE